MARFPFASTLTDQLGRVISGGTVSVFLTGTSTAATVYAASSGGSSVGSVTTGTDGSFEFWIDETEYDSTQRFRLTLSGGSGFATRTIDDVNVSPLEGGSVLSTETAGDVRVSSATPTLFIEGSTLTGTTKGAKDVRLMLQHDSGTVNSGGEVVWVANSDTGVERWISVGGAIQENAAGGVYGDFYIATKAASATSTLTERFYLTGGGLVGIGNTAPAAKTHITQESTTAAIPVLELDQDDVDQPFINFDGTTGADTTSSVSTHGTSGATTDHIQIELNGAKAWIAVSTNNPSA